ncbi:hypothetical protein BCR44DRAFT_1422419 [Catenaria anguillulae PL171]|uniref:Uncharacterized protein n=1 Tax=Catenaria anguillulae PL171 TaxID=765915 RepID=A0A1Y2I2Z3_9FUNG|nr:hypothetical protein BCR44DRAFT_1422419 [Catenaria anguillulae PL171]
MLPPVTSAYANHPLAVLLAPDNRPGKLDEPLVFTLKTGFLSKHFQFTSSPAAAAAPGQVLTYSIQVRTTWTIATITVSSVTSGIRSGQDQHTIRLSGFSGMRVARGTDASAKSESIVLDIDQQYSKWIPPKWTFDFYPPGTAPGFDRQAHPATAAPVMTLGELDQHEGYALFHGSGNDQDDSGSPVLATLESKTGQLTIAPGVDVAAVMVAMGVALEVRREEWMLIMIVCGLAVVVGLAIVVGNVLAG